VCAVRSRSSADAGEARISVAKRERRTYTAAVHPARRALAIGSIATLEVIRAAAGAVVAALVCGGCGGEALRGNVYRDEEAQYRIGALGGGWERVEVEGQNDLAWHSPSSGAIVQVNATCDPDSDVPLTALTNHLLIGFTERDVREQQVVAMDGREALRTHVVARLDGVERELLFYVMKKDECVYDFALIAPPGTSFASATAEFDEFVASFTTVASPPSVSSQRPSSTAAR
jgi:hypothetical protein